MPPRRTAKRDSNIASPVLTAWLRVYEGASPQDLQTLPKSNVRPLAALDQSVSETYARDNGRLRATVYPIYQGWNSIVAEAGHKKDNTADHVLIVPCLKTSGKNNVLARIEAEQGLFFIEASSSVTLGLESMKCRTSPYCYQLLADQVIVLGEHICRFEPVTPSPEMEHEFLTAPETSQATVHATIPVPEPMSPQDLFQDDDDDKTTYETSPKTRAVASEIEGIEKTAMEPLPNISTANAIQLLPAVEIEGNQSDTSTVVDETWILPESTKAEMMDSLPLIDEPLETDLKRKVELEPAEESWNEPAKSPVEEPIIEEPVVEQHSVHEPVIDESFIEDPVINESTFEEPVIEAYNSESVPLPANETKVEEAPSVEEPGPKHVNDELNDAVVEEPILPVKKGRQRKKSETLNETVLSVKSKSNAEEVEVEPATNAKMKRGTSSKVASKETLDEPEMPVKSNAEEVEVEPATNVKSKRGTSSKEAPKEAPSVLIEGTAQVVVKKAPAPRGKRASTAASESPAAKRTKTVPLPSVPSESFEVCFTGLDVDDKLARYQELVHHLGGKVVDNVLEGSPILCTDRIRRTVKFLCAVAKGLPIVDLTWLDACHKANSYLDPSEFILQDKESETKFSFRLSASLERAKQQPLLAGYQVLVTQQCKPPPEDMALAVRAAGGTPLTSLANVSKDKLIVIAVDKDKELTKENWTLPDTVYSSEFILSGILKQELDWDRFQVQLPQATKRKTGRK